jgi:hypothetical protein
MLPGLKLMSSGMLSCGLVFADVVKDRSAFIFSVYRFKKSNRANNKQTDQSTTKKQTK